VEHPLVERCPKSGGTAFITEMSTMDEKGGVHEKVENGIINWGQVLAHRRH